MKIPTNDRSFDWSFLSTTGWKYEQLVDCTSRVYADQSINSIVPDNWLIINSSFISKTDRNLRQLIMADYGYMIDFTRQITDWWYVGWSILRISGRKLAQYNNISNGR